MIHTASNYNTKFDDSILDKEMIIITIDKAYSFAKKTLSDDFSKEEIHQISSELQRQIIFAELSNYAIDIPFLDFDDIVNSVANHVFDIDIYAASQAMEDDNLLDIVIDIARDEFNIDNDGTYIKD